VSIGSEDRQKILKFAPSEEPPRFYGFGPFRFEVHERLLFRSGDPIPLTPKVAELLLLFLQSRGRLLSKESLMSALWADSYVEESNLKQNVFVLRKTLGNGAESEEFIQTVPRRGYRFIAEVSAHDQLSEPSQTTTAVEPSQRRLGWIAVLAIALFAAGAIYLLNRPAGISPSAHEAYLKGRHHFSKRTSADFLKSVEYFRSAVEQEPRYALAWAGLADVYNFTGQAPRAKVAAQRALEIDDRLAQAHTALANVSLFHDFDWPAAERHLKRAIELDPSYATAHHWYAFYFAAHQRFDEALAEIERARQLEPLSLIINTDAGHILYYARRYDEAITKFREILKLDANFVQAHHALAQTWLRTGDYDAAAKELSSFPMTLLSGELHAAHGDRARAAEDLQTLERSYRSSSPPIGVYDIARLNVALGDSDAAIAWLEKSLAAHDGELTMVNVDSGFDPIRDDPRFRAFLGRMKFNSPVAGP
jgi:DNA-binding winged helix-turn-helix (wHTH) protein/Tfp pilus assembly protein PilF